MSCPTCDHTMHTVSRGDFWCPRCGTSVDADGAPVLTPKLVDRCRLFGAALTSGICHATDWQRLGIAESIHKPEDRQQ